MSYRLFLQASAFAALTAGAVRMGLSFVPWQTANVVHEGIAALVDLGFLFGFIGLYLETADRTGITGMVGFFLGLSGIACIVGPDAIAFGVDFYQLGGGLAVIGAGILSVQWIKTKNGPIASALLWLATFLASLASLSWPPLFPLTGFLFGAGFLRGGLWLMAQTKDKTAWI